MCPRKFFHKNNKFITNTNKMDIEVSNNNNLGGGGGGGGGTPPKKPRAKKAVNKDTDVTTKVAS